MPLVSFSGLASGIDSEALINATSDAARQGRVKPYENQVTELENTNTKLEELTSKLSALQSLIRGFATIYGGPVSKQAVSGNESIITATASNSAINSSYSVTVTQLAQNGTYTFASANRTYTSYSAAINPDVNNADPEADRTVSIQIGSTPEETINIVLTNTSTLSEFVTEFNSKSSLATASIINVGTTSSPDYQIMISTHNQGLEKGAISVSIGSSITGSGVGAFDDNASQAATNAIFSVAGISGAITRQSNTVSDLIAGVTFQLQSVSATAVTISVSTDADTTVDTVKSFVESFNELVKFVKENNLIERKEEKGKVSILFSPLAKTRVDDNVLSSLRMQIAAAHADSSSTSVAVFSDIGITTERDGTLKFDENKLRSALASAPQSVAEILQNFADEVSLTNGTIDQYIRFNGLIDLTIDANKTSITGLSERIARAEELIDKQAETMKKRFAQLESLMAKMQNQQQGLLSALGLNQNR